MGRPISIFNSAALAAGATWTSDWILVADGPDLGDALDLRKPEAYPHLFLRGYIAIATSTAADGLALQTTYDQVTILTIATTTLTVAAPGTLEAFRVALALHGGKFARVRVINGLVAWAADTWLIHLWPEERA